MMGIHFKILTDYRQNNGWLFVSLAKLKWSLIVSLVGAFQSCSWVCTRTRFVLDLRRRVGGRESFSFADKLTRIFTQFFYPIVSFSSIFVIFTRFLPNFYPIFTQFLPTHCTDLMTILFLHKNHTLMLTQPDIMQHTIQRHNVIHTQNLQTYTTN